MSEGNFNVKKYIGMAMSSRFKLTASMSADFAFMMSD